MNKHRTICFIIGVLKLDARGTNAVRSIAFIGKVNGLEKLMENHQQLRFPLEREARNLVGYYLFMTMYF